MKRKHKTSINLLKNKDLDVFSNFVKWTLTYGRIIIVITEIIALSAFLYRFSLDQKLSVLKDEIEQKQNIVTAQKDNEKLYRNLQDRLSLALQFSNYSNERHTVITDILNLTPEGIVLNNISLGKESIDIDASINSISDLSLFINSLKTYEKVESITINNIEKKQHSNILLASITADLKKSQFEANDETSNTGSQTNQTPANAGL